MSSEQTPVVSIGTIIGGATADAECWKQAIHDVWTRLVANRDSRGDEVSASELKVNFEVHIGGDLWRPEFEGVRTGYFRKRDHWLKVQIGLPQVCPPNAIETVEQLLEASVREVDVWVAKQRYGYDTSVIRELIASVQKSGSA